MLVALRATHEHLDLGVLDALTRGAEHLGHVIEQLNAAAADARRAEQPAADGAEGTEAPLRGWVVLATCNRLEIYLDAVRFHDGLDVAARAIATTSGLSLTQIALCLETAVGASVAEHLYEVTAGLRSIVLGEAEIAGQVRTAFQRAQSAGHTTALLNDLFQIGFRFAKQVATRSPVGAAGRSGVAIALDRAEALIGPLREADVLVVGTGAYARVGAAELVRRGARSVRVHSASGRAVAFAQRQGIEAITPAELPGALASADLVLACSGRGTSLFPELFLHAGPTLVLDLALHSDLHPLVRHKQGIEVLDLTDLTLEVDESSAPALAEAKAIIAEGVDHFRSRQESRRVDPAMAALRRAVDAAAEAEVARLRRTTPEVADEVERSVHRILAKVLHSPTARARRLAQEGGADEFVEAFHTLFGIDISSGEGEARTAGEGAPAGWMRLDRTVPPGHDSPLALSRAEEALAEAELVQIGAERTMSTAGAADDLEPQPGSDSTTGPAPQETPCPITTR